jgi:predicted metal-binding protein
MSARSDIESTRIGIIICDRYRRCAGGKCIRSMQKREGAFDVYTGVRLELVGYTTCDGCPGGNVEYAGEEMVENGAHVIHLATGLVVGYPPCPYINTFVEFLKARYGVEVVVGTHPIPEKYLQMHKQLWTWEDHGWQEMLKPILADESTRLAYN